MTLAYARPPARASRDLEAAARIALLLLCIAALTAGTVVLIGAGTVRGWLGFGFGGVEDRPGEVVAILANNLRVLAAILIACIVAQLARRSDGAAPLVRFVRGTCDLLLAAAAGAHALVVGAGVGAYGGRMVAALVPHGPVELASYSLALALYAAARREPLSVRRWANLGGGAFAGLALAATLEVFVTP
jgi:hypothetical protein